jgi:hypothetical protein
MAATLHGEYRFECVYQTLTDKLRDEIIGLWMDHGAVWDIDTARGRVDEVAFIIRNSTDALAGVSTVYATEYGPQGDVYLSYRMFIQPADRVPGLMRAVTRATRCFFDANPDARGGARGMLIYAENPKLMSPGVKRAFERTVWQYAGKDHRSIDIWKYDFSS